MDRDFDEREEALTKRAAQERLLIGKLSREDLEDKYLKIYDENILLKKHCRKQEEKIKKMATKLLRLVNDKKRSGVNGVNAHAGGQVGAKKGLLRDVETEELIAELQQKLAEADLQNKRLREKVQLQALQSPKKPNSGIYDGVNARIDTGLPKRQNSSRNLRTISTSYNHFQNHQSPRIPQHQIDYGQLYEEKAELEDLVQKYQSQIVDYEQKIDSLRMQLKDKELNFEEDLLRLKNQVSQEHKQSLQENIDQIRLQRELKEKSNQYTELFQKYNNMQQQHMDLKGNHDHLLAEIDRYHQQLKQEQQKSLSLKTELKNLTHNQREVLELKERIEDLQRDNEILKESNEKLLNSAFSLEREREFREKEKALKIQIAQLEATLKADVGEKGSILDKLTYERTNYDKLNAEYREMQVKYYEMKQKYDEMNEKLMFINQEGDFDFKEIEEALIIVKERKNKKHVDFVHEYEDGKGKVLQRKFAEMEAHLAETVRELEKQRQLLLAQIKINENYKREVSLIQNKMEENKSEYDKKLLEQAQLLDIKQASIKKLERQLKDIAYGTKQVRVATEVPSTSVDEIDDKQLIANLERGQNIFEIHLTRLVLSEEAVKLIKEHEPSTFCTIEFFEHELQTSPILKGTKPEYNFTSQYVVKIDDFFLHYLQKETTTIELHQALGSDYRTLAACQLSFRDIIDSNIPRLNGTARLISVDERNVGITIGTLEYWVRLILPVDQAFRLYKERTKALGYISSNTKALNDQTQSAAATKKLQSADNMNELHINILRCSRINSKEKGKQPAAYCVYHFFDFKDHDTEIITASNYPEFNDHKSYPVQMDIDLDRYLRKDSLAIYLFDDNQPENDPDYLGIVRIPLIALAHDKDIKGTFELLKADGRPNGTIDVNIYWKYMYQAPPISTLSKSTPKTAAAATTTAATTNSNTVTPSASNSEIKKPTQTELHHEKTNGHNGNNKHNIIINSLVNGHNNHQPQPQQPIQRLSERKSSGSSTHSNKAPASIPSSPRVVASPTPKKNSDSRASSRASSAAGQIDAANSTIRQSDNVETAHYNDTYFGDDPRTMTQQDWQNIQSMNNRNGDNLSNNENDNIDEDIEEEEESRNSPIQQWIDDEDDDENNKTLNRESRDSVGNGFDNHNGQTNESINRKSNTLGNTYDDDADVISSARASYEHKDDKVIIEIESLALNAQSDALKRNDIQRLFVSINFLDYDSTELDSESKPKPTKPNQVIKFNFRKEFLVDNDHHFEDRQQLANALFNERSAIITFSVVVEPNEEDGECEDIAFAHVDMNDILNSKEDYIGKQIKLIDANDQMKVVGFMTVTVEILDALIAIRNQMQLETTS